MKTYSNCEIDAFDEFIDLWFFIKYKYNLSLLKDFSFYGINFSFKFIQFLGWYRLWINWYISWAIIYWFFNF